MIYGPKKQLGVEPNYDTEKLQSNENHVDILSYDLILKINNSSVWGNNRKKES